MEQSVLLINAVFVVALIAIALRLYNWEKRLKQKDHSLMTKQQKLLERTEHHATTIIRQAVLRAHDLIISSTKTKKQLEHELEEAVLTAVDDYKDSVKQDLIRTEEELSTIAHTAVQKNIDLDFAAAKKDIEAYKKSRIEAIDAQILKQVEALSTKVFAESLTEKDHQKLINLALEKAKKELFVST